jgi:hypothetical protein
MDRPERFDSLPNSLETVQEYISSHSRQG